MTTNPIAVQLESARVEVEDLRLEINRLTRQFEVAKARLEAFEIASRAFESVAPKTKPGARVVKQRNRLPSSEWQAVFQALCRDHADGFGYDDIFTVTELLDMKVQRPSLRTKMMNYVNDGYAERIGDGRFAITRKGIAHFKIQAAVERQNENGEAEASPDTDEVAASSTDEDWQF